jgi:LysR family hca operon transcriptional activator
VIEIAAGYRKDNPSPVLKTFLASLDQLVAARDAVKDEASREKD